VAPQVRQVSESVYCIQRKAYLSCSYLIARPQGVVLVDAGMDGQGGDALAGLAAVARRVSDVRAIVLTHWHNDHSSGAARMKELSGATVYYHEAAAPKFTRAAAARGVRRWLAARLPDAGRLAPFKGLLDAAPPRALAADRFVRDGDVIEDGLLVMETPGHEDGHLSFWFEPERVLFAGDALAVVGDHVSYISRWLTKDVEAARRSMVRCLELPARAICPGHRYPLVGPSSEHLAAKRQEALSLRRWPIVGC